MLKWIVFRVYLYVVLFQNIICLYYNFIESGVCNRVIFLSHHLVV